MAVGPSAPPMMPMELASAEVKPSRRAVIKAIRYLTAPAAPNSRDFGLAIRGAKSVIAPTPAKMSGG